MPQGHAKLKASLSSPVHLTGELFAVLVHGFGLAQPELLGPALPGDAAEMLFPDRPFPVHADFSTGSTDMGDLSCIMPVVHPYSGGCKGKGHGNDFCVEDPEASCVDCAKWQLTMLLLLLGDGAARAKKILADFTPLFPSAKEYLEFMDSLNRHGDRIVYNGDGSASVRID